MLPEFTLDDFRNSAKRLYEQSLYGCGNGGCLINKPTGMHTNAGCRCDPRRIAADLRKLAEALETRHIGWK